MSRRLQRLSGTALVALGLATTVTVQALSLEVEQGRLIAVSGLEVQGTRYHVTFADGAFDRLYPAGFTGYGPLAEAVARALLAASDSGALQADPRWRTDLTPRGCLSHAACTILIPEQATGAAPTAATIAARELLSSAARFRSVTATLWPFDAATDTGQMPDLLYAIITIEDPVSVRSAPR